jgi:hypothetical protein
MRFPERTVRRLLVSVSFSVAVAASAQTRTRIETVPAAPTDSGQSAALAEISKAVREAVRSDPEAFPLVSPDPDGRPAVRTIQLNGETARTHGDIRFDAIRFRVPPGRKQTVIVGYSMLDDIGRLVGAGAVRPDVVFRGLPLPLLSAGPYAELTEGREVKCSFRPFQAIRLQADQEYYFWFSFRETDPVSCRILIAHAEDRPEMDWTLRSVEEAAGLERLVVPGRWTQVDAP